jgi:hypothetical protein
MDADINSLTPARIATAQWWMPSTAGANAPSAFAATLERAKRAARTKRAQRRALACSSALPDSPPPEVQREMAAAASVSQTLAARGQELRFGRNRDGRVSVELTDAAGRALCAIGPSELFRLLGQGD